MHADESRCAMLRGLHSLEYLHAGLTDGCRGAAFVRAAHRTVE